MKKAFSALLLVIMLAQVLPLEALATVGRVMSADELAAAYAMTGLGTGGLTANGDGTYHDGMKPNDSWSASQLRDWLDEKLKVDLNTASDLLSQAAFTLSELKESDPDAYEDRTTGHQDEKAQEIYLETEQLRETLRYYYDQLTEASGVIAEYGRILQEQEDIMFDSDRVRYSACIEEARAEIVEIRQVVVENSDEWEAQLDRIESFLQQGLASNEGDAGVGSWMAGLFTGSSEPVTATAKVARVSPSTSRANRLSAAAGVAANDIDAKITVITENEVAITLQTGTSKNPAPVKGVDILVRDATKKDAKLVKFTTNNAGTAAIPVNQFKMDEYEIVHLYIEVDPRKQGFRDFTIEDLDLAKGEPYTIMLTPLNGQGKNGETANAANDVYPYMMSFNGRDIMNSNYDMIYSTANDYEFEIKVAFRNTAGKNLPKPVMRYYGARNKLSGGEDIYVEPTSQVGDVYTFKGKWKQLILPTAGKDRKPVTFMFGKNAAANLTFPSKLVSHRSATDAPIDEGTGSTSVFQGVLENHFSLGFKIPKIDVNVNLKLPFLEYVPRINIDLGGYVTIFMGSSVFEDDAKKLKNNWQYKDVRGFQQAQSHIEKKGIFGEYMSKYNLAKDFYKTKGWKFMGESKIDVGIFIVATGRWNLDEDVPDVKSKVVKLKVGSGITAAYSFSWVVSYTIGPVPLYVSFTLGIAAGFAVEHALSFCWVNGRFQNWELRPYNECTISINISLAAALGVGIKGFLDAWVEISTVLSIIIRLSITSKTPSNTTVEGEVKLSIGATIFILSFRKDWVLTKGVIWSSNQASNLLDAYMNADKQKTSQTQVSYAEPQAYPELAKDAKKVTTIDALKNQDSDFGVVEAAGKTFAFHLQKVKGKDGKEYNRVSWQCLNPNKGVNGTGSTQAVVDDDEIRKATENDRNRWLQNLSERSDYAFDVAADDRFVFLLVTAAKDFDKDGFPVRSKFQMRKEYKFVQNMMAYLVVLESDGKGNLSHRLSEKTVNGRNFVFDGNSVAGPLSNFSAMSYDSFTDPRIDFARRHWNGKNYDYFEVYGEMTPVAYQKDTAQVGATGFVYQGDGLYLLTDRNVKSGMGDGYERTKVLTTMMTMQGRVNEQTVNNHDSLEFVALSQPKNGAAGDRAIELFDFEMNKTPYKSSNKRSIVLDKGDIDNLVLMKLKPSRDVNLSKVDRRFFYIKREKSKDGATQNRLYGLVIAPTKGVGAKDFEVDVTRYVYDAVIPTNHFDTVVLNDVTYLYWVAAARKDKESDPTVWRIWAMAFDPKTNTVLDPSVLAEFKLDKLPYAYTKGDSKPSTTVEAKLDMAVSSAILLSSGTGYLNAVVTNLEKIDEASRPRIAPIALYSFEEKLKPAANLVTAVPRALAVKAGDFEDVNLGIMNEGNVAITTFDISMYEVVDGKAGDKPVETVHINALDPAKSKITLANGKVTRTGKEVAYRQEDYGNISRKHDWVVDSETKAYKLHKNEKDVTLKSTDVIKASKPEHKKTAVLMPGAVGSYCASFRIPENWKGEKTLRLKLSAVSVTSNAMAAVAAAEGMVSNDDAPVTLNYALNDSTGKLELQSTAADGAVRNAIESGLFANEIEAADTDMVLNVHDIEVKHRIYEDSDGEEMLAITIRNYAATRELLKLTCAIYADDASESSFLSLPLYESATSNRRAQTITLPVNALVDEPEEHRYARVVLSVVDTDENAYANNEFDVLFDHVEDLSIVDQPEDVTVQEGEDVSFDVEVDGGVEPYAYQWQVWDPVHEKWVDLPGFTDPVLSREDIEMRWDGCRFRCVITDAEGIQVISEEGNLTLRDRVPTGEDSHLPLYLIVAAVAIVLLMALRRRREVG